jgi:hypothetical protein
MKKQYVKPRIKVIKTKPAQLICSSGRGYDPDAMP